MNQKDFTTCDLNLSAVLVANGISLSSISRKKNDRFEFHFQHTKLLEDLIKQYWDYDLTIEPQKLFNSVKAIKNRMYSLKEDILSD